jgi:alpha-tubulin suppressor-like RCC1 family protein
MRESIAVKLIARIVLLMILLVATLYGCGGGSPWGEVSAPDPPSGVTVAVENSQIIVNWNPVTGARSYNIYWATTAGVNKYTKTKANVFTSPYIQAELTYGTTYYYVITAINDAGESQPSGQVSAMLQVPLPVAPSGVSAVGGDAQVTVKWDAVAGASSYSIYWSTTAGAKGTRISGIPGTFYTHAGLSNGVAYYYVVCAVNDGGESLASTQVSAMPQVPTPGAPSGVSAAGGDAQVTVRWDAVAGASSYSIYWSTTAGAKGTRINGIPGTSYTHAGLTNGVAYYYVVCALNDGGESLASTQVSAVPQVPTPGVPSGVSAAGGNAQVTVTWDAVAGASSYSIYWSTTAGAKGTRISGIPGTSYTHAGLANGVAYYYVICAVNDGGESLASTQVSATPQVPSPGVPSGVSAAGNNAQVTVNWNAVSGAKSYNIYWSTTAGVTTAAGTKEASVSMPYTHTGLTNGTTYYYIVTAVNDGGESLASTQVSATPQVPLPDAPSGISAVGGNAQVTVSWNAVSGANSYNIYYTTTSGVTPLNGTKISSVSSPYTISGLTYGSTYYFVITAVNSRGEGATSPEVGIVLQLPAPRNPSAIPGTNKVTLSWESVPGAASYSIYYSTSPNVTTSDQKITGILSPSYVHAGLTPRTTYYYRISSVKDNLESSLSAEVSAVPLIAATTGISAGTAHTVLLKSDGTVWTTGLNLYGQYGDGTFTTTKTLTKAGVLSDVKVVAAGAHHTLALKRDGTLWAWGENSFGQIGNDIFVYIKKVSTPSQVTGLTDIVAVSAGDFHNAALSSNGTVWAWGYNIYGQVGDGTTNWRILNPAQIAGLTGVKAIAVGSFHTLALKEDGTVWAWGHNAQGQLGNGTTVDSTSPVQVIGLNDVIGIAAGYAHSTALKSDGTVWTWGYNTYGQVGDGANIDKYTPVQVSGLSSIITVDAKYHNSIALALDGSVWTWGLNANGQLGIGTYDDSNIPVKVNSLSGIVAVSEGTYHAVALAQNGTVWTWGSNVNGQLGDETANSRTVPISVSDLGDPIEADFVPTAPQAVVAIPDSNSGMTVNWQPAVGAVNYTIYYSDQPGVTSTNGVKIANVSPPYYHAGLPPNVTHYYIVTSVNSSGVESTASDEVSSTTQLTALPSKALAPTLKTALAAAVSTTKDYHYYTLYDNRDPNSCLSKEHIAAKFKSLTSPDLGAMRQGMLDLFQCSGEFFLTIPFDLDYYGKMFILATYVSHNMAPYGPIGDGPNGVGFYTQWPTLKCDAYARLALLLFRSVTISDGNYLNGHEHMFGYDNSLSGNHAQLIYDSNHYSILTDPTLGIAAQTSFQDLFAGIPVKKNTMARFYSYYGSADQPVGMQVSFDNVNDQLLSGQYASDTVLYHYYDLVLNDIY